MWTYLKSEARSEWIRFVTFDFESCEHVGYDKMVAHSDWATIDEQLSTLVDLESVFVVFQDEKNLQHFASNIIALRMPLLNALNKVKFLLTKGRSSAATLRWLFCTPSSVNENAIL